MVILRNHTTLCIFFFSFLLFPFSFAFPQKNAAARYEIDRKREGVLPTDKDALPRSREFIRLDSTYYVGWMYEGIYKYDRSADFTGYKNAIPPLRKALSFFEKDFGSTMKNLYSSVYYFSENVRRYQDLFSICNALKECYDNIEMPDSVIALLDNIDKYHFRKDFFGVFYHRAWTYHRNRFYTSKNYSFLKNSVEENEKMAFQWCYKGLAFIDKYKEENDSWFGDGQSENDKQFVYHYLALLHCYVKNYDSAEYYYQKLIEGGGISWNNYGSMQSEIGNFANSIAYFQKDQFKTYQRMLREPYYYIPVLYVYGGRTKQAISMAQEIIAQSGSTPGFGWYNIALARAYLYDGQLDSCEIALNKAANFKELHIGTTLTQSQYDFSINLLRVQLYDKKIALEKFIHKGWWYSPSALYNIASYKLQKMMAEYVVVNEMIFNPERDRLVYDLFCAESTTTFDEAWYLLKDFSPAFFIKKYEDYQRNDKRANIRRYFQLYTAKFLWEKGNKKDAVKNLENIRSNVLLDTAMEKLYIARVYEVLCNAYKSNDDKSGYELCQNAFYETYPQLMPYSGIKMEMKLSTSGVNDAITKQVTKDLQQCNIDFTNGANRNTALASIVFAKKGNTYEAIINVKSGSGKPIVSKQQLLFKNADGVGVELALRLFGKGGGVMFEKR